ncbi:hypothetical protein HHK36_019726 [Tetracentron sinense]|uniref:Uncharacterized protein n=1 Tax=Tetracentron sinense TaxID=13715 RepID=A0A834YY19_TETSI|nr:hypothetical protein HHK36_019726 [Tetracentron sinense]
MGDYRSYQGDVPRTPRISPNRGTPPGFCLSSVPYWEKQFCCVVCSIPWEKLLETKKTMSYHENVVQWNDSAGEEAFHKAKNRFWAEINGLPCGISLPDPDIYIDEIDWNSNINPDLLLDLDKKPVLLNEEVEFLVDPYSNQPILPFGWGDAEEDPIRKINKSSSGSNLGDYDRNVDNGYYPFELSYNQGNVAVQGKAWGGREDVISISETWEFLSMRFQVRQTIARWMEAEGKVWIHRTLHSHFCGSCEAGN